MTTFNTVIVGIPYYDFNKVKLERNSRVSLVWDKSNVCSNTAVMALYYDTKTTMEYKLGHIRKEDSEKVLKLLDKYGRAFAEVKEVGQKAIHISISYNTEINSCNEVNIVDNTISRYSKEAVLATSPNKNLNIMKETNMIDKLINTNKIVAGNAAYMEAGRIATNQLAKIASSKAPLMVRGYVDTPVGKVVIANLAAVVVTQYRPNDVKLAKLANAMMQNAYMELIHTLDVEGMIAEFLDKADVKAALDKVTEVAA